MSSKIVRKTSYPFPARTVYDAVVTREYWEQRVAEIEGPEARLESYRPAAAGVPMKVTLAKPIPPERMPALAQRLALPALSVAYEESWDSLVDGRVGGRILARIDGFPVSMEAEFVLHGDDSSCLLEFDGTATARIPLLGKAVEAALATGTEADGDQVTVFTTRWLRDRCS